jgi:hypothetical protein
VRGVAGPALRRVEGDGVGAGGREF